MKRTIWLTLLGCLFMAPGLFAQSKGKIDSVGFFKEDAPVEMTLTTDLVKIQKEKGVDIYQPATVSLVVPGHTAIEEPVAIAPRGHFRRDHCNLPPIMVDFKSAASPRLSPLGKLKLVIGCGSNGNDEQLVIREYLAYKIYNLLEDKSFRVRLVKVNYKDTRGKVKPFSQYAFLIEDDKDLAKRNGCIRRAKVTVATENTDRQLMTKVAVFEYMISNGDWSVPYSHNIRLIFDKKSTTTFPFPVPYDFDHSGFVNADYAVPNEILGTDKVTERVYRGFPREMAELQTTFDLFREKKSAILSMITDCTMLTERNKKELVSYINEFYTIINNKKDVQKIFIDNARTK